MSRAARRHVVGNDVSTLSGFASAAETVEPADARDTEPTVDPREPAWKRAAADDPRLPAWRRVLAAAKRISAKKAPPVDPTLPVSAQIVAIQIAKLGRDGDLAHPVALTLVHRECQEKRFAVRR